MQNITITKLNAVLMIPDEPGARDYWLKYDGNCTCYQLVYKLEGRNRLLFDGKEYEERKDSLRFLPQGRVNANYEVYVEKPGSCIDLCFLTAEPINADCFLCYFEQDARIRGQFLQLEQLWRLKREGYYHRCMALVYEILTEIEKKARVYLPSREEQLIRPAVELLEEHFLEEIPYHRLAELCEISGTYFRRLFHQRYGMSPIQFVTRRRIRYACELLSTNRYSVTQVAGMAGYENVYYFSRMFKQVTGLSPLQYVKREAAGSGPSGAE